LRRGAHVCRYTSGDDQLRDATRLPRGGLRFTDLHAASAWHLKNRFTALSSCKRETPRRKGVALSRFLQEALKVVP
jgi:hypothetical protein